MLISSRLVLMLMLDARCRCVLLRAVVSWPNDQNRDISVVHQHCAQTYSVLSAVSGSMLEARRAGSRLAAAAATSNTTATPANVAASVGETPINEARSHLPAATA